MVRIHRPIRRLKDTFQCARPYDEIKQQQRLNGRRVSSTKTLLYLPSNPDSNYNMNFNEISSSSLLFSSLINKKQKAYHDEHVVQQSKLKNLVLNELKTFFRSRNQNHRQQNDDRNSETHVKLEAPVPVQQHNTLNSISSNKLISQRIVDLQQILTNKKQFNKIVSLSKTNQTTQRLLSIPLTFLRTSTTLLASFSFLTNILLTKDLILSSKKFSNILNLLSNTLFYSTSFIFGCLSIQCIKQTKFFFIPSLLLPACLTLLADRKIFSYQPRTLSKHLLFTHQDILLRIITSVLHFIAALMIKYDDKNNI